MLWFDSGCAVLCCAVLVIVLLVTRLVVLLAAPFVVSSGRCGLCGVGAGASRVSLRGALVGGADEWTKLSKRSRARKQKAAAAESTRADAAQFVASRRKRRGTDRLGDLLNS